MAMGTTAGRRERKKRQTREAIVRAAYALFAERGFDATTISDIAEAADIAPRTFFGYFPSKEAVVFHDLDEQLAGFQQRLRTRAPHETAFDALRDWVVRWVESKGHLDQTHRLRQQLIDGSPALQAHDRANLARFEALLAAGVAADLGVAPDSLRPHLVSSAAIAAIEALRRYDPEPAPTDIERAIAVMDEALAFLQGGLQALRERPPAII